MEDTEIDACLEEGRFFLATEAMNAGSYEDAIAGFQELTSPEASYNVAQVHTPSSCLPPECRMLKIVSKLMQI